MEFAEKIFDFLDAMKNNGYSPQNTVNMQKIAVSKILNTLNENEKKAFDTNEADIDSIIKQFKIKTENNLKPSSINVYAGSFKKAYEGFIKWNKDPNSYKPKTRQPRKTKNQPPTFENSSSNLNKNIELINKTPLNANTLVRFPIITTTIRGSIELPEKLSDADIERIIPYLTQVVYSLRFEGNQQHNTTDNDKE